LLAPCSFFPWLALGRFPLVEFIAPSPLIFRDSLPQHGQTFPWANHFPGTSVFSFFFTDVRLLWLGFFWSFGPSPHIGLLFSNFSFAVPTAHAFFMQRKIALVLAPLSRLLLTGSPFSASKNVFPRKILFLISWFLSPFPFPRERDSWPRNSSNLTFFSGPPLIGPSLFFPFLKPVLSPVVKISFFFGAFENFAVTFPFFPQPPSFFLRNPFGFVILDPF